MDKKNIINKVNSKLTLSSRQMVLTSAQIGYIIKGERHIYHNKKQHIVEKGELYFLEAGEYLVEDIADSTFEMITFRCESNETRNIITKFKVAKSLNHISPHQCENCTHTNLTYFKASRLLQSSMLNSSERYDLGGFDGDEIAQKIKFAELIHLICNNGNRCFIERLKNNINISQARFEQIIHDNILKNKTLKQIAEQCGYSLSVFKQEFKRTFNSPPHRWILSKRLHHAKHLLATSNKSIAKICNICKFSNSSHFIRQFKSHYGITPAQYREGISRISTSTNERKKAEYLT